MPSLWLMRNADGETRRLRARRRDCRYCTDARGEPLPYEQVLETNARFYAESQGVTATATAMAHAMLADMPAWRGRH